MVDYIKYIDVEFTEVDYCSYVRELFLGKTH